MAIVSVSSPSLNVSFMVMSFESFSFAYLSASSGVPPMSISNSSGFFLRMPAILGVVCTMSVYFETLSSLSHKMHGHLTMIVRMLIRARSTYH